jgi:regulator of replication initiation timing
MSGAKVNEPGEPGVEQLQNELWDAGETIGALEHERDRLKLELQRLRERSSIEMAEAKVAQARLVRVNSELAAKVNRLEAEYKEVAIAANFHVDAKRELLHALRQLVSAYTEPETPEA